MNFLNLLYKLMGRKPNILERTLWVWFLDLNKSGELLDFCKNKRINQIYLCIDLKKNIKPFINNAHKQNIKVKYLDGKIEGITERIREALDKNLFDGIHLDLEVQKDTNIPEFNLELFTILNEFKCELDVEGWRYKDIVYRKILDNCSTITLMGYENSANKIIKNANNWKLNKPFFIGIETSKDKKLNDCSFGNLGEDYMEKELNKVEEYFKYDKNFKGFAFHHYSSFKEMKK